jgi:hypothetical protein
MKTASDLMQELRLVTHTFEVRHGEYVYRLMETVKGYNLGVSVRRLEWDDSKEHQLWSHGVLTQLPTQEGWKPTNVAKDVLTFPSFQSALEWITK